MKIDIKGPIISSDDQWIYDYFEIESTSPKKVNDLLSGAKENEELEIIINSGGGSVFAGSEIYTALKSHKGNTIAKIVGIAASAASVIAMAANRVAISPTAQIMIHNVSSIVAGDYRDLQHEANVIENMNKSIANAYALKTNLGQEELLELMNNETWLNAQQAKEKGFANEIMFDEGNKLVASFGNSQMLPAEVMNKIRNELIEKKDKEKLIQENKTSNELDLEKARLNLRRNL
jgi:ATP-dependent Clp protease protease subunit